MKSLYFWLILHCIAVLPAAFFGVVVGGNLGYISEFRTARAMHRQVPESHMTLYSLEVIGGLLFGLPGMISVGWFYRKQKRECEKQASVVVEIRDETVWPPPPLE